MKRSVVGGIVATVVGGIILWWVEPYLKPSKHEMPSTAAPAVPTKGVRPTQPVPRSPSANAPQEPMSVVVPTPHKAPAADVYMHPSGSFQRQGEIWVEYPPYAPGRNFRFKEALRDDQFIYLYDETRHKENDPVRVFYLRLPVAGGMAEWSYPNPFQWQPLYPVTPKTR